MGWFLSGPADQVPIVLGRFLTCISKRFRTCIRGHLPLLEQLWNNRHASRTQAMPVGVLSVFYTTVTGTEVQFTT